MDKKGIVSKIIERKGLLRNGFELIVNNDTQGIGLVVFKKNEQVVNLVSVWIDAKAEYSKFIPSINYTVIEEFVQPIFNSCELRKGNYVEHEYSTIYMKDVEKETFEQMQSLTQSGNVGDEDGVAELFSQLNGYLDKLTIEFFEKWSDINILDELIDETPQMELAYFLGIGAIYKKAVVYKLCGNSKFEEYFDWLYTRIKKRYTENPDGDISLLRKYNVMEELKKTLPNI